MRLHPKLIVGKTVSAVELNCFSDGRGRRSTDPRIFFTDGSSIAFVTEEVENDYGTGIIYHAPPRSARKIGA